jgi:hypothetical protein
MPEKYTREDIPTRIVEPPGPHRDYRDLTLEMFADAEADLREANRQMVDLIANLAWDNACWRRLADTLLHDRVHLRHELDREQDQHRQLREQTLLRKAGT